MNSKDFTSSEAAELHAKSTLRAIGIFAFDLITYVGCIIAILLVSSVLLKIVLAITAGLMAGLLFVVGHDCAHQSFTRYRTLNRWLGRLALLPSLHPYGTWDLSHNKTHHRFTNQRGRDYVWEPLSLPEYTQLTRFQKWKYRFFRSVAGHMLYNLLEIWWPRLFFPRSTLVGRWERSFILDHVLVVGWLAIFPVLQLLFIVFVNGAGFHEALHRLPQLLLFTMVIPFLYFHALFSGSSAEFVG
jgi:acyl-lipid omega-6 desaturase (Delta-12 desaturase)